MDSPPLPGRPGGVGRGSRRQDPWATGGRRDGGGSQPPYANTQADYWLVIHPSWERALTEGGFLEALDPDNIDPYDPEDGEEGGHTRLEVMPAVEVGRINGVRFLEGEALQAVLIAIADGTVKPVPIATPLPAPWLKAS